MSIYQKLRGRPSSFGNHITVMKLRFFVLCKLMVRTVHEKSSSILVESYLKLFENTFEGGLIFPVGNARVMLVFLELYCIYLDSIVFVWKRPCLFSS